MKRIIVLLALASLLVLSGCSVTASGRRGGQNMETIHVDSKCPSAQSVGDGSCGVSVWKLGGGN